MYLNWILHKAKDERSKMPPSVKLPATGFSRPRPQARDFLRVLAVTWSSISAAGPSHRSPDTASVMTPARVIR